MYGLKGDLFYCFKIFWDSQEYKFVVEVLSTSFCSFMPPCLWIFRVFRGRIFSHSGYELVPSWERTFQLISNRPRALLGASSYPGWLRLLNGCFKMLLIVACTHAFSTTVALNVTQPLPPIGAVHKTCWREDKKVRQCFQS
jgi:hypothetical protein